MSHNSTYFEALKHKGRKHITQLEANGRDLYYNKKRNIPDGEEREYDGAPTFPLALLKQVRPKAELLSMNDSVQDIRISEYSQRPRENC